MRAGARALAILDWLMPNFDCLERCRRIRSTQQLAGSTGFS